MDLSNIYGDPFVDNLPQPLGQNQQLAIANDLNGFAQPAHDNEVEERLNAPRHLNEYFMSPDIISIKVGLEEKLFCLPIDLLRDRVPFFRQQLDFERKYNQNSPQPLAIMSLPNEAPTSFGHLVDWLFTDNLRCKHLHQPGRIESAEQQNTYLTEWIDLFILAESWGVDQICYLALKNLQTCHDASTTRRSACIEFSTEIIDYVYQRSPRRSLLRAKVINEAVNEFYCGDRPDATRLANVMSNHEFCMEFMKGIYDHLLVPWCLDQKCTIALDEYNLDIGAFGAQLEEYLTEREGFVNEQLMYLDMSIRLVDVCRNKESERKR